jgi:hypothetical protein
VVAMVRRITMFGVSWSSGVRIRVRIRDEFSLKWLQSYFNNLRASAAR